MLWCKLKLLVLCHHCSVYKTKQPDEQETIVQNSSLSSIPPLFDPNVPSCYRIYDKEGLGYITTETLRGLIGELLAPLTNEELEGILEELDEDGSGSMDFDEFCEMMMTKPE